MSIIKELWTFMKVRKKFWLAPVIIIMLLLGTLIVASSGSVLSPFVYALF
ncbi:MAG: DUF5989 family protein [Aliarcobacter sp.]|nr:DUF5989 family protein [Aliarcobacter sp.]